MQQSEAAVIGDTLRRRNKKNNTRTSKTYCPLRAATCSGVIPLRSAALGDTPRRRNIFASCASCRELYERPPARKVYELSVVRILSCRILSRNFKHVQSQASSQCIKKTLANLIRCMCTHSKYQHEESHTCVALGGEKMHVRPAPRVSLERIRLRTKEQYRKNYRRDNGKMG